MSRLLKLCLGALLMVSLTARGDAAIDVETGSLPSTDFELVVVEAEGCIYCHLFRRDVLPAYERSKRAQSVPIRFVDINELEAGKLELKGVIGLVPTVLLVRGGAEVGRIPGYTGPENFFHSINLLLSSAE